MQPAFMQSTLQVDDDVVDDFIEKSDYVALIVVEGVEDLRCSLLRKFMALLGVVSSN